jgi:prepilin-type N-terminal cleavage/methylation domain-containing protein
MKSHKQRFSKAKVPTVHYTLHQKPARTEQKCQSSGFTLLELLVTIVMIAVLMAIAAPGWLAFLDNQRLNASQSQVFEVLRRAQTTAKLQRLKYQASFREQNGRIQWAIHPITANPVNVPWNSLEEGVRLSKETTLSESEGIYKVQFNHYGEVNGQLGRVTLSTSSGITKRCVIVSTLLGMMRTGENRPRQKGNPCD